MQSQQPVRWAKPPVPRAKPVDPNKWAEHKEELRDLHGKMKLRDLMVVMKIRHNFTPSRRQYVSQFETWDFRKYQQSASSKSAVVKRPVAVGPILPEDKPEAIQTSNVSGAKRQRSLHSLQSSQMSIGSKNRPPVPPKKRQLLEESSKGRPCVPPKKPHLLSASSERVDPYMYLDVAFGDVHASRQDTGAPKSAVFTATFTPATFRRRSVETPEPVTRTSSLQADDDDGNTVGNSEQDAMSIVPSTEFADSLWSDYEPSLDITPRASTDGLARVERQIDSSRPIESFSHDELVDMKLAADCLSSLTFAEEAFPIHVLIVKSIKQNERAPPGVACSALIACAQSCGLRSQLEIAQSLLKNALQDEAVTMNDAQRFVYRMLLADTYTSLRRYEEATALVKVAWLSVPSYENFIQCLPDDHCSLDLLLYHYMSRYVPSHRDLTDDNISESYVNVKLDSTMGEKGFRDQILHKKPGPFELEDGRFSNPCLRSCVTWCAKEILGAVNEPGIWKAILSGSRQQRLGEGAAVLLLGSRKMTSRRTRTALTFALELYLWQRWQLSKQDPKAQKDLLWASEADKLMGIPASNLLGIIAKVIIMLASTVDVRLNPGFLPYAQFGVKYLAKMSDKCIGKQFLQAFSFMIHVEPRRSDPTDGLNLLSWRGIFGLYHQDNIVREIARTYATDFIEKTLFLCLPEVHNAVSSTPVNRSQTSLHLIYTTMLPTIASSLKSSQLSSLRILSDRVQRNVRNAMQDTSMALPSAMFGESHTTLPSVDQLSQAMGSRLSLISRPQTADTVMDVLASISDNMMYRIGDLWENGAHYTEMLIDPDSEDEEMDEII